MTDAAHAVILIRSRGGEPARDIAPPPHLHAARVGAGALFLAALLLLAHAYRRLRDRARAEEANAFLREEFERLERPSARATVDAKEP